MAPTVTLKEITAGYVVAGVTLCLGVYLGMKVGKEDLGGFLMGGSYLLAIFIVVNFTFAWGRLRGFAARREDGSIVVSHVIRNLVMAAMVWVVIALLFGPLVMLAVRLAR